MDSQTCCLCNSSLLENHQGSNNELSSKTASQRAGQEPRYFSNGSSAPGESPCLNNPQPLVKTRPFTMSAWCLSYEIPEVIQRYKIIKVPVDCSFHIQTSPSETHSFQKAFQLFSSGVKYSSAEGQLHTVGCTLRSLHCHRQSEEPFTMLSQCSCARICLWMMRHCPQIPVLLFPMKKASLRRGV